MSGLLNRKNTSADVPAVRRDKRSETNSTAASDDSNEINTELKASRQVISLLQRQLELIQVEKEGLEKLVVSQSQGAILKPGETPSEFFKPENDGNLSSTNEILKISQDALKNIESRSPDEIHEIHRKLLKLIKTQLYAKDEEIVKLKSSLKEAQNEKERVSVQLHMLEDDISKLKSENALLKENLALRDQTIVSLSNEVFEQTSGKSASRRRQSSAEIFSNQNNKALQKQIAKLSDTLEAYKKTNDLLSKNVVSLTDECSQAQRKEIETRSQCQELEAKCCQIQSKLLSLLKEIEQSSVKTNAGHGQDDIDRQQQSKEEQEVIQSESVKLLIKRLLEDKSLDIPLSWKVGNKSRRNCEENNSSRLVGCDELGFFISIYNDDCNHIIETTPTGSNNSSPTGTNHAKSRTKGVRRGLSEAAGYSPLTTPKLGTIVGEPSDSSEYSTKMNINPRSVDANKRDELSWRLQWDNFVKDFDTTDLSKSKNFKKLLRTGVPQEYRCKVWKAMIGLKIGKERQQYGPDYYQSLLEPKTKQGVQPVHMAMQNPTCKQIELDLLRTLPNNKYFETMESTGTVRLRRVLNAFSVHEPQVGYCQGMNRLAAVALLVLPEEEAFWCLVAIVDKIMPSGYYNDLWLAQVDSNVVIDFVTIKMPQLSDHFKRHGIELSFFAWFLTIFVDGTPPALFLRLWDCFLYEGDKIMFRVALALLKRYENDLLKIDNSVAVNNFIRSIVIAPMDIDHFFEIAFDWINPLPGRLVRQMREHNFQTMRSSLKSFGTVSGDVQLVGRSVITSIECNDSSVKIKQDDDKSGDEESLNRDCSIISV